jgi:tetraacyldisaccharide 4'-kinase
LPRVLLGALSPAQVAFDAVSAVRRALYRHGLFRVERAGPIVLSVGNLTVGGTGKTPVAAMLARELRRRGRQVTVALRGYGTDEVALHRRWNPDVPVFTAPRRIEAVRLAAADGADVVVLDDGFQHLAVARDLDVVLVSSEQWIAYPGHRTLPRGPYREPPTGLARADLVIVTERVVGEEALGGVVADVKRYAPNVPVLVVRLVPGRWMTLDGHDSSPPEGGVLAVAGIADPESFQTSLGHVLDVDPELVPFADHHEFTDAEIADLERRAGGRTLVTTEKDAVRLMGRCRAHWKALGLRVRVEDPEGQLDLALDRLTTRA